MRCSANAGEWCGKYGCETSCAAGQGSCVMNWDAGNYQCKAARKAESVESMIDYHDENGNDYDIDIISTEI